LGCFCGTTRPLHSLERAGRLLKAGDASGWLLVPRAAVAALTALLSMLRRSRLPLEIQLMAASFVQLAWWKLGGGRCSRSESSVLTAADRAAITAAVPRGIDSAAMLRAAEIEPLNLTNSALL